jgi:hypothetical protein
MSNAKIERALYGPSLFEVTLGALLSVLVGVLLATMFLVFKPAIVAQELPKEEERVQGAVYFLEGKKDAARSKQWHRKRQLLLEGTPGEITFTEEELNAWFASGETKKPASAAKPAAKPAKPAKPGEKAAAEPDAPIPDELLTLETPNVRIREGVFQVGVPGTLNLVYFSVPVVVQTRGHFQKVGEIWAFQPDELYVGSMPLHRIPKVTEKLAERLMRSSLIPDDAMAAWKRVSEIGVDGKQLKLVIQ